MKIEYNMKMKHYTETDEKYTYEISNRYLINDEDAELVLSLF